MATKEAESDRRRDDHPGVVRRESDDHVDHHESGFQLQPLAEDVQNTYKQVSQQFSLFFLIGTVFLAVIISGLQFSMDTLTATASADAQKTGSNSIYSLPFFFGFLSLAFVFMTCVISFVNSGIMAFAAVEGATGLLVPNYWYRLRFCYASMLLGFTFFFTSLALTFKDYLKVSQNVIILVIVILTLLLPISDAYVTFIHFVRLRHLSKLRPVRDEPRVPPLFYTLSRYIPPGKWYLSTASRGYLGQFYEAKSRKEES